MSPTDAATLGASLAVVIGGFAGWLRYVRPRWHTFWHRLNGTFDAITGRDEYVDPASGVKVPALPPLTSRVANVETAIVEFRHVIGLWTEAQKRIDLLEHRVKSLEDIRIEKVVNQAESAQYLRLIADENNPGQPPAPPVTPPTA